MSVRNMKQQVTHDFRTAWERRELIERIDEQAKRIKLFEKALELAVALIGEPELTSDIFLDRVKKEIENE